MKTTAELEARIAELEEKNKSLIAALNNSSSILNDGSSALELRDKRIAELEAAIEWALGEGDSDFGEVIPPTGPYWWRKELRARAFPPKMETVEVKRWERICTHQAGHYKSGADVHLLTLCKSCQIIELTGTYQRPIPTKVKRREELSYVTDAVLLKSGEKLGGGPSGLKLFAEWEE